MPTARAQATGEETAIPSWELQMASAARVQALEDECVDPSTQLVLGVLLLPKMTGSKETEELPGAPQNHPKTNLFGIPKNNRVFGMKPFV